MKVERITRGKHGSWIIDYSLENKPSLLVRMIPGKGKWINITKLSPEEAKTFNVDIIEHKTKRPKRRSAR